MATWPATLPSTFLDGTYKESPPDNSVSQKMDVGPPQKRQSSTAGIRPVGGRMVMTTAQVATFDTFYDTTLGSGSLSFDGLDNQRTGSVVDHMFLALPKYSNAGPDNWFIDMQLGELP
jgi:hypothetical protein